MPQDPSKTSLRADGLARLLQGFARHLPDMSCGYTSNVEASSRTILVLTG